jgi:hypothetical protein
MPFIPFQNIQASQMTGDNAIAAPAAIALFAVAER